MSSVERCIAPVCISCALKAHSSTLGTLGIVVHFRRFYIDFEREVREMGDETRIARLEIFSDYI